MRTRRKSALDELLPCARYQDSDSVSVPVDGSVICGDRIEVTPPSMSNSPALAPASRPVTRSLTPLTVVPSCLVPLELVAAGSPRSHCPVVAVSVPLGLVVQPAAASKLSEYTVTPGVRPQYCASLPMMRYGQSAYSHQQQHRGPVPADLRRDVLVRRVEAGAAAGNISNV